MPIQNVDESSLTGLFFQKVKGYQENIDRLTQLQTMPPRTVASLLNREHPQVVSVILSYLESSFSGKVLDCFTERLRTDVLLRLSVLTEINPLALHFILNGLEKTIHIASNEIEIQGREKVSEVLRCVTKAHYVEALDAFSCYDPELATLVSESVWTFENLLELPDDLVNKVLREIHTSILVGALAGGVDPLFKEKLLSSLSKKAKEQILKEVATLSLSQKEVSENQETIMKVFRQFLKDNAY